MSTLTFRTIAPLMLPVVATRDLDRVAHHRVMRGGHLMIETTIDGNMLGTFSTYGPAEAAACEALERDCACRSCGDYSLAPMCAACAESDPPTGGWGDPEPGDGPARTYTCFVDGCSAQPVHMHGDNPLCCAHYAEYSGTRCLCTNVPSICETCDGEGRIPCGDGCGDQAGGWAETCPDCDGKSIVLV